MCSKLWSKIRVFPQKIQNCLEKEKCFNMLMKHPKNRPQNPKLHSIMNQPAFFGICEPISVTPITLGCFSIFLPDLKLSPVPQLQHCQYEEG